MRMFHAGCALRRPPAKDQSTRRERCPRDDGPGCAGSESALIAAPAAQEYFREAESWDADRAAQFRRSAHTAWWVAGAGWSWAVASALALALRVPLKRGAPFVGGGRTRAARG